MAVETNENKVHHTGEQTFLSSKFKILDATDPTKVLEFDLSGITAGATSSFTVPDVDGTFVTLAATQTLTNKTLTNPTVNAASGVVVVPTAASPAQTTEGSVVWDSDDDLLTVGDGSSRKVMVDTAGTQTLSGKTLTNPTINAGSGVVVLPAATSPAQTAEGSVVWDSDDDLLTVGDGSARKVMVDTTSTQTLTNKTLTSPVLNSPTVNRTAQSHFVPAPGLAKVGATAGWVVAAAANTSRVTLPAAQTASTLVIPVVGLKVGWTITGFHLVGQIESAGNAASVDASLFKLTAAAADLTDASIGAITQLAVTADTEIAAGNSTKTLDTPEVVAANESFYVLVTATTAADTDIDLMGVQVIVTEV